MMSFKTRIFVISILIVSAVLAVVMSVSWIRLMAFEINRLDTRLCIEAKRIAGTKNERQLSTKLADDLASKLRVDANKQLLLLVGNRSNSIAIRSANWPERLDEKALAWSEAAAVPKTYSLKTDPPPRNQKLETCRFTTFSHNDQEWRAVLFNQSDSRSLIGIDLAVTESEIQAAVQSALILVMPIALLTCALGAWLIASITTRPLNRLLKAMQQITQRDLSHRLSIKGEDHEFKSLIHGYNEMLNRLEKSFQQASRFSADAAHELKTPLTVLRGRLEQAVSQSAPEQLDLNSVLDEVGKLSAITRKLLLLSQADAGTLALHYESINLSALLQDLISDIEQLQSEEDVVSETFASEIEKNLVMNGDSILLRQLLNNLLSNAMRYRLSDTPITIAAHLTGAQVEIKFSNECQPLLQSERERLFDRFYRGNAGRSNSKESSGLGLSLSREIARAHGGELTLEATAECVASFRLRLPVLVGRSKCQSH